MSFDVEYDLVVCGGGASGKSAAYTAAKAGKSVVVLEKMPETGGLSVYAEGTCAFESPVQKRLGKPMHPDRHFPSKQEGYEKFNSYSHERANFDVVRSFVDNSWETIQMYEELGVNYLAVMIAAYDDPNELWTFHIPEGKGAHCQEVLLRACENEGVDFFVNSPAKELIVENGKVCGVVAQTEDGELRVGGKAVVLATGGMGSSAERLAKYSWFATSAADFNVYSPLQNVGDGMDMALAVGADPNNITTCPLLGVAGKDKAMDSHYGAAGLQPSNMWVNRTGKRFASEGKAENIADLGTLYAKQRHGIVWSITDQENLDRIVEQGSEISIGEFVVFGKPLVRFNAELEAYLEDGSAHRADSIEELASQIDIDPETLKATVDAYYGYCETGEDTEFFKAAKFLKPIKKGPFYAIQLGVGTMGSSGGIKINGNMQVVNEDYEPIPGLYAVGLDATGLYGDSYNMEIPGASNGFAHTSGRLAARHAMSTYMD